MEKKSFVAILGPATIVSVAYIDPGNFGSNIAAGSLYGLTLLWIVWLSGAMAILFQYLSGKLGIATKKSTADHIFLRISKKRNLIFAKFLYFGVLMIMILATDMAEFLGIALGLHLIFGIPLLITVWLSVIDILILMSVADRLRLFEAIIGFLVFIVGVSYIYEMYIVKIDPLEIASNSFTPKIEDYKQVLLAASIIGATVMPHAVLLHSYLTAEKWRNENNDSKIKKALKRHMKETIAYLSIASLINASLQIMAYYAFHKNDIIEEVDMDIAYYTLIPLYGSFAAIIFAVAILASGISSSMVSVLAGQKLVESLIGYKLKAWQLRLIVRLINAIPLTIALYINIKPIDVLVYSQAVLSLTLPFVLIPLVFLTAKYKVMKNLKNNFLITLIAIMSTLVIVFINMYLIFLSF